MNAILKYPFTFQSGYIPMLNIFFDSSTCSSFTFQSGYIPIDEMQKSEVGRLPLHSNLVIFQYSATHQVHIP